MNKNQVKLKTMRQIRIVIIVLLMSLLIIDCGYSQTNYSIKAEAGSLIFLGHMEQVDPGPDWKGHNLEEENGVNLNAVNGFLFNNKTFVGIGIGYLNFDGVNGTAVFSDLEYLPLKTKLTPLINLKFGYSHLWNQYKYGTGTGLGELNLGINYRSNEKFSIYAKAGFTFTQQSLLVPITVGIRI